MTYTALERLPDGRERILAHGLTLDQALSYRTDRGWAVYFRQESQR